MSRYFWCAESWGSDSPPINYEAVCAEANRLIAEVEYPEGDSREFADQLWENFCASGVVGNVTAIYEEEHK